jgi:Protein of unknown function (DUF3515)
MLHPRSPLALAGVTGVAVVVALCGCGRAVTVTPAVADSSETARCQVLNVGLPDQLSGERRVAVANDNGTTAAWGGPAIVWRCGVSRPPTLVPTSQLITVDGVDWFPQELTDGTRFTTAGRRPWVELTVPDAYPAPAGLLADVPTAAELG